MKIKLLGILIILAFIFLIIIFWVAKLLVRPQEEPKIEVPQASASTRSIKCFKIPILTYHYVENVTDERDTIRKSLAVTPANFEGQLKTLKENGYQTLFVSEIADIASGDLAYNPKSIALTFDDSHTDFYTDVLPLLEKYQAKATLYVIVDFLDRLDFLKKSQLQDIAKNNLVEIGSHTLTHPNLASASSQLAQKQINESKLELEELIGKSVATFAYPYGSYNQKIIDLVKTGSYKAAVSARNGACQGQENLFYLSRIRAGGFSGQNFLKALENLSK